MKIKQHVDFFNFKKKECPLTQAEIIDICQFFPELNDISLAFLSKEEMAQTHATFKHVEKVTDVLSFPFEDSQGGEILFCLEEVKNYCQEIVVPYKLRFAHLLVHSLTHLLGYDHINPQDAQLMLPVERARWALAADLLKLKFDFTNEYEYIPLK